MENIKNQEYQLWMTNNNLDFKIKNIISKYDSKTIAKHFDPQGATFGTAGLRAIMDWGSAYFNIITVTKAAIAYSKYLREILPFTDLQNRGVVVCHDNRRDSKQFAVQTAHVLQSFKIKVFLAPNNDNTPTPLVSYLIKRLKLIGGVMITASHNPKDYNGFKIFNDKAYQYLPSATKIIQKEFESNTTAAINFKPSSSNQFHYYDLKLIDKYQEEVLALQLNPQLEKVIKITFSNLHGVTQKITPAILKAANYNFHLVKEHYQLDPNFTNAVFPNPELEENYKLPILTAQKNNSDLIILNDPDGDRIGVCVRTKDNQYQIMNTNDLASIVANYLFSRFHAQEKQGACYSSVVSSNLMQKIALNYNIKYFPTLTGFKWMGHAIKNNNTYESLFAYEEACGMIVNPKMVYDKDGISAALIVAEIANYYKLKNLTLFDHLNDLYKKYGYFAQKTVSVFVEKKIGLEILSFFRHYSYHDQKNFHLTKKINFLRGYQNLPKQNLLKFYFENQTWFAIRRSGTEPKVKIYFEASDVESKAKAKAKLETLIQSVLKIIADIKSKLST